MQNHINIKLVETLLKRRRHLQHILQEHDRKCVFTEATTYQLRGALTEINELLTDLPNYIEDVA